MLWILIGILVALWGIGLLLHIATSVAHVLLVLAIIVFVYNMLRKRDKKA
ncbi:MAG: lmo0937 family membrane protein [Candidatus Saccharimonadales bacterium]